tara:strand:- start:1103 stop:1327 length:225 start_codon:yes stop_codon:yes gene_type:complete
MLVGYYVRFTQLKLFAFSLSKRRDIEFAKGPRFDSAFEYTHARTFSFFFSPFFSIIFFQKVHKKNVWSFKNPKQ